MSTGKFVVEHGSPLLGKSLSVVLSPQGHVVWVGNDKGHIESVHIDCSHGVKVQKGCRVMTSREGQPVTSLSYRSAASPQVYGNKPLLLANLNDNSLHLFTINDEHGSVSPLITLSSGSKPTLLCSTFAPLLSYRQSGFVASGAEDGSLVFFDLRKRTRSCVNKLLGHAKPVTAVTFSPEEKFLASADASGQIIVWKK